MQKNNNSFDIDKIQKDFPILDRFIKPGVSLIYLDSAATSQKPSQVLQVLDKYFRTSNANIHRGIHVLAEESTELYENARSDIAAFIGARSPKEIIFTRNTTESINLIAYSWGRKNLKNGDLVVLTEMEHHSNLVPWYMLAQDVGIRLEYIPVLENGLLDLDIYGKILIQEPKLVSFLHMSNVLGTINPAQDMIRMAHQYGALTLLDGAQSVPHLRVNVSELDVDFLAFSGHKMCGPTGIGVLYGKKEILEEMPPFLGGGDMIRRVYFGRYVPNELPYKFEAGTPAIGEAIGLGAAVTYISDIGIEAITNHEKSIVKYALDRLNGIPGLKILGPPASERGGVTSFTMEGIHPHDISQILDSFGIAIRAGHHCAMPLHDRFNLPATARASYYLYNTQTDVDHLVNALYKVKDTFGL